MAKNVEWVSVSQLHIDISWGLKEEKIRSTLKTAITGKRIKFTE